MEKIYMEENNSERRSSSVVNFSVVLSFVVAIFAVFSLATFGVVSNQGMDAVSYAAPIGTTTGDTFTFSHLMTSDHTTFIRGSSEGNGYFSVPIYTVGGDKNKPVFCVEHNVNAPDNGTEVKKGEAIEDYGLLYILNNSYTNGNPVTNVTGDGIKEYVEEWVTQIAIWMYLYETKPDLTKNQVRAVYDPNTGATADGDTLFDNVRVNYLSDADVAAIKGTTKLEKGTSGSDFTVLVNGANLYEQYVAPLVQRAKEVSGKKLLAVSKAPGEISKTNDGKYYQSTLISVLGNPSNDLQNFDIALSGVEGAFLVDDKGNDLALNAIPHDTAFYVRIPVEKVTEKEQTLDITATGHFTTLAGNYFTATENGAALQKVITVTGTTRNVIAGNQITFVGSPDTGMNTAQTIYFIGLIVLLCGVGIVYANAKPVESKQQ